MKKVVPPILIGLMLLAGLCLFFYPNVSEWLSARNHSTAIQLYRETVEDMDSSALEQERLGAQKYNEMLTGGSIEDPFIPGSGMVLSGDYTSILNLNGSMGHIEIPGINVSLPIYHGTGEDALKKGVGHLDATAFPIGGTGNHTVLTGHRGLPSAKLFTDLDQLEEGDVFYLHVLDDTLAYQVDQIDVIEPSDTGELRPIPGEDYVTLITCTPYAINSHRLLIRGTRIPYSLDTEDGQNAASPAESPINTITLVRVAALSAVLVLLATLILASLRARRRRKGAGAKWRRK